MSEGVDFDVAKMLQN